MPGAVDRWEAKLRALAIPDEIIADAPESPWTLPVELFKKRAENALAGKPPSSTPYALEVLPEGGSVLDVGAGAGAASLPLAHKASRITAFDTSEDMLQAFAEQAGPTGVQAETILGTWPDDADRAPAADVVVCHHVLYNAPALEPFVAALTSHALRRVVVEITDKHPLTWMNPLWLRFHRLERPEEPSSDDVYAALEELGLPVQRQDHTLPRSGGYESREAAVASVRRRLCLPAERDGELMEALRDELVQRDGLWTLGPSEQTVTTFWWGTARPD